MFLHTKYYMKRLFLIIFTLFLFALSTVSYFQGHVRLEAKLMDTVEAIGDISNKEESNVASVENEVQTLLPLVI